MSWPPSVHQILDVRIMEDDRKGQILQAARVLEYSRDRFVVHGPELVWPFKRGKDVGSPCILVQPRGGPERRLGISSWAMEMNQCCERTYTFRLERESVLDALLG